jgi:hypothetical protein
MAFTRGLWFGAALGRTDSIFRQNYMHDIPLKSRNSWYPNPVCARIRICQTLTRTGLNEYNLVEKKKPGAWSHHAQRTIRSAVNRNFHPCHHLPCETLVPPTQITTWWLGTQQRKLSILKVCWETDPDYSLKISFSIHIFFAIHFCFSCLNHSYSLEAIFPTGMSSRKPP